LANVIKNVMVTILMVRENARKPIFATLIEATERRSTRH